MKPITKAEMREFLDMIINQKVGEEYKIKFNHCRRICEAIEKLIEKQGGEK